MDAIAGLLDGPRARRPFLLRCTMDPPWALDIRDEAPLSLIAMLRGRACFAAALPRTAGKSRSCGRSACAAGATRRTAAPRS